MLKIEGNICPVPLFLSQNEVQYETIKCFVRAKIEEGITNFYCALSASEFEYCSLTERVGVVKAVAEASEHDELVKILAQPVGDGALSAQLHEARLMFEAGANFVVVKLPHIKDGASFISSKYERRSYSPQRFDRFFLDVLQKFNEIGAFVLHNIPFSNGSVLSDRLIDEAIGGCQNFAGMKVHVGDRGAAEDEYRKYSDRLSMFDGFSKHHQIFSFVAGASARHTVWSWFDGKSEVEFLGALQSENWDRAIQIIDNEYEMSKIFRRYGYSAYKLLSASVHDLDVPFESRIPGEMLTADQVVEISKAHTKYVSNK